MPSDNFLNRFKLIWTLRSQCEICSFKFDVDRIEIIEGTIDTLHYIRR